MRERLAQLQGIQGVARTIWRDRGVLGWLASGFKDIGYLGWVNQGNVGDELMRQAHAQIAKERELSTLPLTGASRALMARRGVGVRTVLLGGGTLVGLDGWARRVESTLAEIKFDEFIVFGPGVEEVQFGVQGGRATSAGMEAWRRILGDAAFVGVRGPRSQEVLRELGIESVIVGDPALCVPFPGGFRARSEVPLVSVNLTDVGIALEGTREWRDAIAEAIGQFAARSYEVAIFGMDGGDVAATSRLLADRGVSVRSVVTHDKPVDVLRLLGRSSLVVSERLHGAIAAANLGVPFLHLGYRPKAYDFAESIGASRLVLGSARPNVETLVGFGSELISEGLPLDVVRATEALRTGFAEYHSQVLA